MQSLIDSGHLDDGFLVFLMPRIVLKIVLMLQSFRINNQPLDTTSRSHTALRILHNFNKSFLSFLTKIFFHRVTPHIL